MGNLVSFCISDCSSVNTSSLPQLPDSMTCSLGSSCTTVKCCMDTAWLGKTVTFEFNLDKCDIVLSAQIETYQRSLNLFDVEMGKSHTGKCICRFVGIYAYCRYFIDLMW